MTTSNNTITAALIANSHVANPNNATAYVRVTERTTSTPSIISVLTETMIDAFTTFVVNEKGTWRLAKTKGGRVSRTGLSRTPTWVEAGAVLAYREDTIYGVTAEHLPETLVLFAHHGTEPRDIWEVNVPELKVQLQSWQHFRSEISDIPPCTSSKEDHMARRMTRGHGYRLTTGEALEGLAQRAGAGEARLIIEEGFDLGVKYLEMVQWRIDVENVGTADGWSTSSDIRPKYFTFVAEGAVGSQDTRYKVKKDEEWFCDWE